MNKRQKQKPLRTGLHACVLLVALALFGSAIPVHAASGPQQAAQIALKQSGGGGKVLGVTTETDSSGRTVFAVKILSNGRVRVVRIPQS